MAEKTSHSPAAEACRDSEHPLGVILFHGNERGTAACWTKKFSGDPQKALADYPESVWLANRTASFLRDRGIESPRGAVHPDGWLGVKWARIISEWGIASSEAPDNAERLSRIAAITAGIADETLECAFGPNWIDAAASGKTFLQLSGLTQSLRCAFDSSLQSSKPGEREFADAARTLQLGEIQVRNQRRWSSANTVAFHVHYPKLRYAETLAKSPAPAPGDWMKIKMPDSRALLSGSAIEFLSRRNRPIVVIGDFCSNSDETPFWIRSWAVGNHTARSRSAFSLEESKVLLEHGDIRIRDAYEGPGWLRRPQDSVLGKCIEALKEACGGDIAARTAWSAGLAAEMLVRSLIARSAGRSSPPSLEAAWLDAADRMAMVRAMEVLQSVDCVVKSAAVGTIEARTRADPKRLSNIVSAVQEEGMILPISSVRKFRDLGAELPDNSLAFNGAEEDRLQAAIALKAADELMWDLNEALTHRRELRSAAARNALRRSRR